VLKNSAYKELTGTSQLSKGFLLEFKSGHVGMVQRRIGSSSDNTTTKNGYQRWTSNGKVEKLETMGSPSAAAMHRTIWPEVEDQVGEYLEYRLREQVKRVIARAARKAKR
jgi:hypothetical protein